MLVGEHRFALFYVWPHMINPQYLDGAKAASQSEPRSQQTEDNQLLTSKTARLCILENDGRCSFPSELDLVFSPFPARWSRVVGDCAQSGSS